MLRLILETNKNVLMKHRDANINVLNNKFNNQISWFSVEIQGYKGRLEELNQVKCFLVEMENLEEVKV